MFCPIFISCLLSFVFLHSVFSFLSSTGGGGMWESQEACGTDSNWRSGPIMQRTCRSWLASFSKCSPCKGWLLSSIWASNASAGSSVHLFSEWSLRTTRPFGRFCWMCSSPMCHSQASMHYRITLKKVEAGLIRGWFFVWWKYRPYREKKLKIATSNETGFMVKLKS